MLLDGVGRSVCQAMSIISLKTVKHLFTASANRCSHPGCKQEMVTDRGVVVGEICHITASRPNGPRYNPKLSDEERDAFGNLILLLARCYARQAVEAHFPQIPSAS